MHSCTCRASSDTGRVKDEVSDLFIEDIGRDPVQILGIVRVSVNEPKTREARAGLECG